MKLYISKEFDLETFEAWGGAVSRLDEIIELDITDEAENYIKEMFDGVEVVTTTDINDTLWFGMDEFIQYFKEDEV